MSYATLGWFAVGMIFLAAVVAICFIKDLRKEEEEAERARNARRRIYGRR